MLTFRQKEILRILYQSGQTIAIRELALALKVSVRTIRYDLNDLSYTLKSQNLRISIVPSVGVSIEDTTDKRWLEVFDLDSVYDNQTRAITLVVHLLLYPKIQVFKMAERFQVSRQTISRDLSDLSQLGLIKAEDLVRTTHGALLNISELHRRDLFSKLIQNIELLKIASDEVGKCFSSIDEKVKSWIALVETNYGAEFESDSKKYLQAMTCFVSLRMLQQADKQTKVSSFLHSELFDLQWDSDGCLRVERAMLTSRLTRGSLPVQSSPDFVEELIDILIRTLHLPIEPSDPAYQSLRLHLLAATNRSKFNQQIDNPLKDDVRLSYSILFEAISAVLKEFEDKHYLSFSENEVAFIVMHIGAIFQSQSHLQSNIAVAVVCQHGAATSNLLHSRLKLLMPNQNLLGPYSVSEYDAIKNSLNFDLVISTIHLDGRDVLVVSPLLSTKDIELIERKLWNLLYQKQCDLLIKNFKVSHQNKIYMHQLVKERHIQIKKPFDHWQKAIECAAKPLLEDGVILPRYVTKMIWAVESLGPYMVILPKIAFVHAGTQDGVIRNGISCLRMSSPISFGNQKATDVQVIFVIASRVKEDMGLLKLVRIIENHDNYDLLLKTDDIKTILALEG